MKDTAPKINHLLYELFREKSGEERLIMGCSMFDTSKKIVISSIKQNNPDIGDSELKIKLFNRLYGRDFTQKDYQKITKHLKKA
ncbi:MAG: hypothetical protein E3J54_02895 [Actinobacteria bacterium]|nr:MAG: hypothetical protein E3J54_02895 [Actinomycetota bacterium]